MNLCNKAILARNQIVIQKQKLISLKDIPTYISDSAISFANDVSKKNAGHEIWTITRILLQNHVIENKISNTILSK